MRSVTTRRLPVWDVRVGMMLRDPLVGWQTVQRVERDVDAGVTVVYGGVARQARFGVDEIVVAGSVA